MRKTLFCLLLAALALPQWATAESYKVSILPRYYPERLKAMMNPLVEHLKTTTGLDFQLVIAKNFDDYENRLLSGEIAVGIENPLVYVRVAKRHEAVAIGLEGADGDKFRGIVIARPDSGIKTLEDLKGKRVMIVGETSTGGFLSQKLSLTEKGIGLGDMTVETAPSNHQENVIISVSIGDVDAGFIRESALHVADKYIVPGSVKVVAETAWLPSWAFSLDRELPAEVKSAITKAVVDLPPDHPVLKAVLLSGFRVATDAEFDPVRTALKP